MYELAVAMIAEADSFVKRRVLRIGILKYVIAAGAVACNERSVTASVSGRRIGFTITSRNTCSASTRPIRGSRPRRAQYRPSRAEEHEPRRSNDRITIARPAAASAAMASRASGERRPRCARNKARTAMIRNFRRVGHGWGSNRVAPEFTRGLGGTPLVRLAERAGRPTRDPKGRSATPQPASWPCAI
jgi:hypothetical protein